MIVRLRTLNRVGRELSADDWLEVQDIRSQHSLVGKHHSHTVMILRSLILQYEVLRSIYAPSCPSQTTYMILAVQRVKSAFRHQSLIRPMSLSEGFRQ